MPKKNENAVALVIGAGDDTGASVARAFAKEGYIACLVRRPSSAADLEKLADEIKAAGGRAHAMPCDARDEEAMIALFDSIEADIGPIEVSIFNIGANVKFSILEMTSRVYRKVWEMAAFAGFLTGRESAKRMVQRGHGSILFTGATASMRGGDGFAAFASAKFALRALAQSMARELGPKNIHVAHVVIDGMIDSRFIRQLLPNFDEVKARDGVLDPEHIAQNYVMLHNQPRSAWTHELDVRPFSEKF